MTKSRKINGFFHGVTENGTEIGDLMICANAQKKSKLGHEKCARRPSNMIAYTVKMNTTEIRYSDFVMHYDKKM